jgi:murein L,D-transpeptidase YcbB/YkuD
LRNLVRLKSDNFQNRPPLRIEVDIARYWLTAYEDNKVVMEMPVVVGTKARSTNRFKTMMTGVRLNPGWTLPPTIKSEDYIPKLRQNPEWVSDQGILIYSSWDRDAQPIDPMTIDWHFLPDNAIRAMRFYKLAGDNNPLGRYRFLMNNQYDIYLHDTNQKYLFDRDQRAYSSGCVRISDPQKLALFLLKDDEQWTTERLNDVIESGETRNVRATRSIPVYFDYKTAWLNEEGDLILGHDIYDLDLGVDYSSFDYKKRDSYTETNTQNFNFN